MGVDYRQPAGELRHRVSIQTRTNARTTQGGFTPTWATAATVWANVEPLSDSEFTKDDKQNENVTHKVRIRFYSGLDTTMRFLYRSTRQLNIISIRNIDERRKIMECLCKEVIN